MAWSVRRLQVLLASSLLRAAQAAASSNATTSTSTTTATATSISIIEYDMTDIDVDTGVPYDWKIMDPGPWSRGTQYTLEEVSGVRALRCQAQHHMQGLSTTAVEGIITDVEVTFFISHASLAGLGWYGEESPMSLYLTCRNLDLPLVFLANYWGRLEASIVQHYHYTIEARLVPQQTWVKELFSLSKPCDVTNVYFAGSGWVVDMAVQSIRLFAASSDMSRNTTIRTTTTRTTTSTTSTSLAPLIAAAAWADARFNWLVNRGPLLFWALVGAAVALRFLRNWFGGSLTGLWFRGGGTMAATVSVQELRRRRLEALEGRPSASGSPGTGGTGGDGEAQGEAGSQRPGPCRQRRRAA